MLVHDLHGASPLFPSRRWTLAREVKIHPGSPGAGRFGPSQGYALFPPPVCWTHTSGENSPGPVSRSVARDPMLNMLREIVCQTLFPPGPRPDAERVHFYHGVTRAWGRTRRGHRPGLRPLGAVENLTAGWGLRCPVGCARGRNFYTPKRVKTGS